MGGTDFPATETTTDIRGAISGYPYRRRCPDGKVVVGFDSTTGNSVYRLALICDDFHSPEERPWANVTAPQSTSGGTTFPPARCEGHEVMTGFYGHTQLGSVRRIGGTCAPLVGNTIVDHLTNRFDGAGLVVNDKDGSFTYNCPTGQVVVGYRIWSTTTIHQAVPLCAPYAAYRAGTVTAIPPAGAPTTGFGTQTEATCTAGRVAQGFEGSAEAWYIRQLRLRCVETDSGADILTTLPVVGSGGGTWSNLACPGGGPATGVSAGLTGGLLTGVGLSCGMGAGDGIKSRERYDVVPQGVSASVQTLRCSTGEVLVGIHGTNSASRIESIGIDCQSVWRVKRGDPPTRKSTRLGQPLTGTAFASTCPLGEVVVGLDVRRRTDTRVRRLQLHCGPPDLVSGDFLQADMPTGGRVMFRIGVTDDAPTLRINMFDASTADYRLYLRRGTQPTLGTHDYRSGSNQFSDEIVVPGTVHQGVYWLEVRKVSGTGSFILFVN